MYAYYCRLYTYLTSAALHTKITHVVNRVSEFGIIVASFRRVFPPGTTKTKWEHHFSPYISRYMRCFLDFEDGTLLHGIE